MVESPEPAGEARDRRRAAGGRDLEAEGGPEPESGRRRRVVERRRRAADGRPEAHSRQLI